MARAGHPGWAMTKMPFFRLYLMAYALSIPIRANRKGRAQNEDTQLIHRIQT
jgi:hypothetical protein